MLIIRVLDAENKKEMAKIMEFLSHQGLKAPTSVQYMIGVYKGDRLVGTGALDGKIIKAIAIEPEFQGRGLTALIVTDLTNKALEKGMHHLFIYTKPKFSYLFEQLGYRLVATSEPDVSLMEWGINSIDNFKNKLKRTSKGKPEAACVVVNCNPFTIGHKFLIEKAASESKWLYVLVVQEDKSLFPYKIRLQLIKEGIKHINNVTVIPGGDYIISAATFPSYFTRQADLSRVQASLDIKIFASHIAPALKIIKRYVGEEPYCEVTHLYNKIMKHELPKKGIHLIEVPRIVSKNSGEPISASLIRDRIKMGEIEGVSEMVPVSTLNYLESFEAKVVIEKIINSNSRH